jgi:hypothetical protein
MQEPLLRRWISGRPLCLQYRRRAIHPRLTRFGAPASRLFDAEDTMQETSSVPPGDMSASSRLRSRCSGLSPESGWQNLESAGTCQTTYACPEARSITQMLCNRADQERMIDERSGPALADDFRMVLQPVARITLIPVPMQDGRIVS